MQKPLKIQGVTILTEVTDFYRLKNLTEEIWSLCLGTEKWNDKNPKKKEKYILSLIDDFPNVATFKAILVQFYMDNNNVEKGKEWKKKIIKKHPNDFLTKLNFAKSIYNKYDTDGAIEVLGGEEMHIKDFIPNTTEYMKDDFISFYRFAIEIHVQKSEDHKALLKLGDMLKVDKDHPDTKYIMDNLNFKLKVTHNINLLS